MLGIVQFKISKKMMRLASRRLLFSEYNKAYEFSLKDPEGFWKQRASQLQWSRFPTRILDTSKDPFTRWFCDGKINITHNMLDRHLQDGLGGSVAYHIESPITGTEGTITIRELHQRVSRFADSLTREFKLKAGDRAIIYMPMTIEAIVAQLACARIGVTHSVVFGGFAAPQVAIRIKDCEPKVIICSTAGKEPNKVVDYEKIIAKAIQISGYENIPVIIHEREIKKRTHFAKNWFQFHQFQKSGHRISPVMLDSSHPLYILYTSGTTGAPKGIYRDHGGTAVILNMAMKNIYDLHKGEGLLCSSDVGWVVGHSFITYGPLLRAVRSVLFEGKPIGPPDAGIFWRLIKKHNIKHLYTSPTAMRGIRKQDSTGKFIQPDLLGSLKGVTLVGQRCDVETFKWMQEHFKDKFINDTYWQTQTGTPILTNYLGLESFPMKPGSACKPFPGFNVQVLDPETGTQCRHNQPGIIVVKQPTPPSFMLSLWKRDEAFVEKYFTKFPGYYDTGDSGYFDTDGYFHIMSRVDDIINTAGHRLSTGEMEEIIMKNPKIAQAIVIGVNDELKGQVPVGFVTLKTGQSADPKELEKTIVKLIRDDIGPVASFKLCYLVQRLPKTRSGKYLRGVMKKMYDNQPFAVPSTIEDMSIIKELQHFLAKNKR